MSVLADGTAAAFRRRTTPPVERTPITDPVEWIRERLNEHPWSVQREVLRRLAETGEAAPRRLAVPACHGPGKSYMASRAAAWWIDTHPAGDAFVVSSAPTGAQVKGILWRELARAHRRGGLPGRITGTTGSGSVEWHIGDELVGWGRKPADMTNPDQARQAFQGIHAPYVLVILDEATGVPQWLWEAATSLLTNVNARILAIGNPDDPSSHFAEVCKPGSGWWVRPISAFDTPAFTGEVVPEVVREGLVSRQWVEEAEQDYGGKDNPLYQSKVLGQFPDTSDSLVISPRLIREAHQRDLPGAGRGAFGFDVARSPRGDESALYRVRGGVARRIDSWKGLPITAAEGQDSAVARLQRHCGPTPAVPIVIDTDGLGAGAYDGAIAVQLRAVPFTAAGPARRADRFDSRRSELWWSYREALARGEVDLDEADDVLAAQLQQPRWWLDARGRIHVESKKEMAKRGKRSPDRADAVIMGDAGAPMDLSPEDPLLHEAQRQRKQRDQRPTETRAARGEGARLRHRPM